MNLPFDDKPIASFYLLQAHTMGIIQGNAHILNQDITPWMCAKFINCSYIDSRDDAKFSAEVFDGGALSDGKIIEEKISIRKTELIDAVYLWNLIKEFLLSGYYVTGEFNERYIPDMSSFMEEDYIHPYLLYGFNEETNSFYASGYLKDHFYSSYSLNYSNFFESIINTPDDICVFALEKYDKESEYVVNYPRILTVFEDYLTSKNTMRDDYPKGEIFGITAIKCLSEYYMRILDTDMDYFDMRYSRALMESKRILVLAIDYLYKYFNIYPRNYKDLALQVSREATNIHYMGLKYNAVHDKDIIKRLQLHFDNILNIELSYLPKVLNDLKSVTYFPEETHLG